MNIVNLTKTKQDKRREYYSAYRAANKEKIRAGEKRYREANKERLNAAAKRYREANKERVKAYQKALRDSAAGRAYHSAYVASYYSSPAIRMRHLVNGAFRRAKQKGMDFSTNLRELLMAAPPKVCACCGRALDYSMGRGRNLRHSASPSLDRIDNSRGYTQDNVAVICMHCNSVKADSSIDDLEAVIRYMRIAKPSFSK